MAISTSQRGFTLIEVMVVLVIIAIMGTFVVLNVIDKPEEAQLTKVRSDLGTIEAALDLYRLDKFGYPLTEDGLQVLVPKYIKKLRKDPWNRDYLYASPGENGGDYDVYTLGRDGEPGGDGIDKDIGSWDLN
jgi:general secretion pathway protein G